MRCNPVLLSFAVVFASWSARSSAQTLHFPGEEFPFKTSLQLRAADLDGDGRVDLVRAEENQFVVKKGDGFGGFGQDVLFAWIGIFPGSIDVADVDSDGRSDVIVNGLPSFLCFRANGFGGFLPPVKSSLPTPYTSAALADMNGDQHVDRVTISWTSFTNTATVYVSKGDGHGGFALVSTTTFSVETSPWDVRVADVDGDQDADVVIYANNAIHGLTILHGDGVGGLSVSAQIHLPTGAFYGARGLAVADLDGDGFPEILAGTISGAFFRLQNLSGTFGPPVTVPGDPSVTSVEAADFDLDGRIDVVSLAATPETLSLFKNGPTGLAAPIVVPSTSGPMAVADVDGDARPDVVVLGGSSVAVHRNIGGQFLGSVKSDTFLYASITGLRDANHDGRLDAQLTGYYAAGVAKGDGAGGFGPPATVTFAYYGMKVFGDFNGDGAPDVAVPANKSTDPAVLQVALGDGAGGWKPVQTLPLSLHGGPIAAGRINGDAFDDLVIMTYGGASANLVTLLANGTGSFTTVGPQAIASVAEGLIAIGEVTGDGFADVVDVDPTTNSLNVLAGDGAGHFTPVQSAPIPFDVFGGIPAPERHTFALLDANDDARLDVFVIGMSGSVPLGMLFLNGPSGLVAHSLFDFSVVGGFGGVDFGGVDVGDVDQDGRLDLLLAASGIGWMRTRGDGAFDPVRMFAAGSAWTGAAGDVDGDGRADIVVAADGPAANSPERLYTLERGCSGAAGAFGYGCAGTGGIAPRLAWLGCPTGGASVTLEVEAGLPGASGSLVFGPAPGSLSVSPGCALVVAPLFPVSVPFALDGTGSFAFTSTVPPVLTGFTFAMQALAADAGLLRGYSTTNGVEVHVE